MKVGDLVRRTRQSIGVVVKVVPSTATAEILWLSGGYLTPLQYIRHLEVINESR